MRSPSSSGALLGLIFALISINVSASPRPHAQAVSLSSQIPTAIVSAPLASSTSSFLSTIPQCAQPCLSSATKAQPCGATDTQCLCAHSSSIKSLTENCLSSSTCTESDRSLTEDYYDTLCVSLGYPLTVLPTEPVASATGTEPTPPTYAKTSATTAASGGSTAAAMRIPIIIGASIGGTIVLALTLGSCIFIQRRRRRAAEYEASRSALSEAPRKPSNLSTSTSATVVNPVSADTNEKSVSLSRKSTSSTIVTMASLDSLDKRAVHPREMIISGAYSDSNYSVSRSSKQIFSLLPITAEKGLPREPSCAPQLSPTLAAFDFGIISNLDTSNHSLSPCIGGRQETDFIAFTGKPESEPLEEEMQGRGRERDRDRERGRGKSQQGVGPTERSPSYL